MKHHCRIHPASPRTSLLAIQPFMLASSMIFTPTAFMRLMVIRGSFPQWPQWMLMDMEYTKLTPPKLPLVRYHWSHKDSIPKKNQFYTYIIRSVFEVCHFHGVESKRYIKNWWTFRKKSGESWWCYCPSCCLVMSWWLPWRGFLRRVLPPKWRRSWALEPFFFFSWADLKRWQEGNPRYKEWNDIKCVSLWICMSNFFHNNVETWKNQHDSPPKG